MAAGMDVLFEGSLAGIAPQTILTHLVPDREFSGYRFHEADPVFFPAGLRLTIRDGETVGGQVCGPKPGPADTSYTTYVWVYEW